MLFCDQIVIFKKCLPEKDAALIVVAGKNRENIFLFTVVLGKI